MWTSGVVVMFTLMSAVMLVSAVPFIYDGKLCMTVEHFHLSDVNYQFWECSPLTDVEIRAFNFTDKYLGTWQKRDCPDNYEFDEPRQRCEEKRKIRRQQSMCAVNPGAVGCQQPCTAANTNPQIGAACNWLNAPLQPDPASSQFFMQCAPQTTGQACGQWARMPCTPGTTFNINLQICVAQQQPSSACPAQQAPVCGCSQQQTCPGSCSCVQNTCCQQTTPFPQPQPMPTPTPTFPTFPFPQPMPQPQPMPMPQPMPVYQPSSCPGGVTPISTNCGSCPSYAPCVQSVGCCQPPVQPQLPMPVMQQPAMQQCPGNVQPVCGCSVGCPSQTSCIQGSCCPVQQQQPVMQPQPMPVMQPQPIPVQQPLQQCPGNVQPVCGCSVGCPAQTSCMQGSCCPMQQQPIPQPQPIQIPVTCPSGIPATSSCTQGGCGAGMSCFQGGCCPMNCPSAQIAISFCGVSSNCPGPTSCYQPTQCCCQQQQPPTCPNGQIASSSCTTFAQCGPGMECAMAPGSTTGACCPLPTCPTGGAASGRCSNNGQQCGVNMLCQNSLCCPMPTCPTGQPAQGVCSAGQCPLGSECVNSQICCPLPLCPRGEQPTGRCQAFGQLCGPGRTCQNGLCCNQLLCPNGQPITTQCTSSFQCGSGMECANGGCCSLPQCPNGSPASQRCTGPCPPGQSCQNGVCCALPLCPGGVPATSACVSDLECGSTLMCQNGGCCPRPQPQCPTNVPPVCPCNAGCPVGFGCQPSIGCCPQPVVQQPVCPQPQQPVCQCGYQNQCPSQSSCALGTCCAQPASPISGVIPGMQCQQSNQCNGFASGCASCVQNTCACTNNAWSNGATCQQTSPVVMQQARTCCSPTGAPCTLSFNTAKRKPVFSAETHNSTNVWYLVAGVRRCPTKVNQADIDPDSTCLPNEMCIKGICTLKLWPGEYGCKSDVECQSRCNNTVCDPRSDKEGLSRCMCADGFLIFGRCVAKCPEGTVVKGKECQLEDEDGFWRSLRRQATMRDLLMKQTC